MKEKGIRELLASRKNLDFLGSLSRKEVEGGCGVIGLACSEKIAGRHLLPALCQMRNRGNGKGGGIAAVGLSPESFGTSQEILGDNYLLAIAYLDKTCQADVEREFIHPIFEVAHTHSMPHGKMLSDLDVRPPDVMVYFVRVKKDVVTKFCEKKGINSDQGIEDEIVYQNTYRLNHAFYASTGEKKAFVLSHGKNLLVLKLIGRGDDVIKYYELENFPAHVWIGHHRYPTKGRVWHPGGAHPFVGLNEALVHNGDFANYFSLCEYLAQRNIHPLFLTDTEVSVLLFDLYSRIYRYPLEYVIEAFAPTTERDFTLLPDDKQPMYKLLQKTHIHGSPDGPWFFLIAQSIPSAAPEYRLIGITDTSMLRPQVFALQNGAASIGFAASEKQAIDAVLKSLSNEDSKFWTEADFYWNARGGSYTDGGAFIFSVHPENNGASLRCSDKFGNAVNEAALKPYPASLKGGAQAIPDLPSGELFVWFKEKMAEWHYAQAQGALESFRQSAVNDQSYQRAIEVMTKLLDHYYPLEHMRRSCLRSFLNKSLEILFSSSKGCPSYVCMGFGSARPHPKDDNQTLIIDACGFPSEGEESLALEIVRMNKRGFFNFILFNCDGQRFFANGLGPQSQKVQIHVYGSSGDYLASGIDGAKVHVHGSAQDQLAQIMNDGCLVVHGDVGQAFMYGAKGGKAFIRGNTAGRPLINAVGKPRVVINGTCLDYLAESFMAGNPLKEGGFAIVNGITFDEEGRIIEQNTPYPGGNLFSLATGGAIYIRDPKGVLSQDQLNGGDFVEVTHHDWELLYPYLKENEQLFDIRISRLLEYDGRPLEFQQAYRKIIPSHVRALQEEEAWVKCRD